MEKNELKKYKNIIKQGLSIREASLILKIAPATIFWRLKKLKQTGDIIHGNTGKQNYDCHRIFYGYYGAYEYCRWCNPRPYYYYRPPVILHSHRHIDRRHEPVHHRNDYYHNGHSGNRNNHGNVGRPDNRNHGNVGGHGGNSGYRNGAGGASGSRNGNHQNRGGFTQQGARGHHR